MPNSQKSGRSGKDKKESRDMKERRSRRESKSRANKDYAFQTLVTLVNYGKLPKGANFSREEVKKLSFPKKEAKPRKAFAAKVYTDKIEFKEKIVIGNRNKKVLNYESISLLEQMFSDSRIVFVNYDMPKNSYFIVLGLSDTDYVSRFMNMVRDNNAAAEIRWADAQSFDRSVARRNSSSNTYNEHGSESSQNRRAWTPSSQMNDSFKDKPWNTTSSYIHADPRFDDGTVYSMKSSDSFDLQRNKPNKHSNRRSSQDSLELFDDHEPRWRNIELKTQYYYIGPSDGEDSVSEKTKQKKSNRYKHQHYTFGDEVSVSMTPSSVFSDADYYSNNGFNMIRDVPSKRAPSRKSNVSRRSSHRSKSRELPLSEAERKKGGWHSDVLFVTPTKNGGVKVSADGPVMLYTATRANGSRSSSSSSDEDSTSGDLSYSSGSTITLHSPERNATRFGMEIDYTNGH